ncbi:MAG TPA: hypothetical protein VMF58_06900 [Rhizomicrobium sp.]|nr:hypothetical protein [Rhizomicrobium sp.]
MISRSAVSLATALIFTAGVPARATDAPMFGAFKKFCIDTKMDVDAMRVALGTSGGTRTPITNIPPDFPGQMNEFWDLPFAGQALRVFLSAGLDPGNGYRIKPTLMASCSVAVQHMDAASIAAVKKWAGVPPSNGDVVQTYDFYDDGGVHKAMPNRGDKAYYALIAIHPDYKLSVPQKARDYETIALMRWQAPPKR